MHWPAEVTAYYGGGQVIGYELVGPNISFGYDSAPVIFSQNFVITA